MRTIVVAMIMALLCSESTDPVVANFMASIDHKFKAKNSFAHSSIKQDFFIDACFIRIDTFVTFVHPTPVTEVPLRIAIDEENNVYRLFGFDHEQYNALVLSEPLSLKAEEMRAYGEFVLDVTELWDPFGYIFLSSTEAFITENLRRMKEAESGVAGYDCDNVRSWKELEAEIRAMFDNFQWRTVCWKDADSVYESEYIAWMETTGALRYFKLRIHHNGKVDKVADSVWSKSFGYYYKYQE